jgi:hypothetical protein
MAVEAGLNQWFHPLQSLALAVFYLAVLNFLNPYFLVESYYN